MNRIFPFLLLAMTLIGVQAVGAEQDVLQVQAPVLQNPAAEAVQELTEGNIEQALAARESIVPIPAAVKETAALSEAEIPVQLEGKRAAAAEGSPLTKMVLGVLVVAGLSAAGYLAARRYKFANRGRNPATQMKVLAQHHLGPKRSLAIVRVAGESILIGVTDHHISLIKSLALLDEDLPEEAPSDFGNVIKNSMQKERKAQSEESDEFAISGIKDFVSTRLKNMRSFE